MGVANIILKLILCQFFAQGCKVNQNIIFARFYMLSKCAPNLSFCSCLLIIANMSKQIYLQHFAEGSKRNKNKHFFHNCSG